MRVGEFTLAVPTSAALVSVPLGIVLIVTAVLLVSFKNMDRIMIWRIRNE